MMPWSQFYHWMQFVEAHPVGDARRDLVTGHAFANLAAVIAASQGAKGVEFKPSEFVPDFTDLGAGGSGEVHPITEEEWREWKRSIKLAPIVKGNH